MPIKRNNFVNLMSVGLYNYFSVANSWNNKANLFNIYPNTIIPGDKDSFEFLGLPDEFFDQLGPFDTKYAMISKKIVTPTQAFNELHMILSALIKQYGQKNGDNYEIVLNGLSLEDPNFVADKQRLSCTKNVTTLDYKVILNFAVDSLESEEEL